MGQGAYKTLVAMLKASPSMAGIQVFFGEEYKNAQEATPGPPTFAVVVIDPVSCTFPNTSLPGYVKRVEVDDEEVNTQDLDNLWTLSEVCELTIWAAVDPNSTTPPTPLDNADKIEDARVALLQAFQSQQADGLRWVPQGGRWSTFQDQVMRYGRGFVMQVAADITYTTAPPVFAGPPIAFEITPEIED